MKVLHIIPSVSLKRGGPSQAVVEMVKALRKEGIDASILSTEDNGMYRENIFSPGWNYLSEVPILIQPCFDSRVHMLREYLISPRLTSWLMDNAKKYDLLHIHAIFSYPSTASMTIARFLRVPYIIRTIGQLNSWSLSQSPIKKKFMYYAIEKGNLKNAKAIHVTSSIEREDIEKLNLGTPIIQVGLGVEMPDSGIVLDRRRSNLAVTKFLYLSRLHPKKQIEMLLESLSILKYSHHRDDWALIIAGTGDLNYCEYLQKLADDLRIEPHIEWLGHVQGKEKQALFRNSDWFVLPSAGENFGISTVEAMAAGLPVIITDKVGVAENVATHQAGLLCGSTAEELSDVLKRSLHGPSLQMKRAARSLVECNYSWNQIVKELIAHYEKFTLARE